MFDHGLAWWMARWNANMNDQVAALMLKETRDVEVLEVLARKDRERATTVANSVKEKVKFDEIGSEVLKLIHSNQTDTELFMKIK